MYKAKKIKILNRVNELYIFYANSKSNKLFLLSSVLFVIGSSITFFLRYSESRVYFLIPAIINICLLVCLGITFSQLTYVRVKKIKKNSVNIKNKNKKKKTEKNQPVTKSIKKEPMVDAYIFDENRIEDLYSDQGWRSSDGELSNKTKKWLDEL